MTRIKTAHEILADRILADAAEHGTRFGDSKVFLSTIPGIDLTDPECVQQLKELRSLGLVEFARFDLTGAADKAMVKASCWTENLGFGMTTETHFVVLPEVAR